MRNKHHSQPLAVGYPILQPSPLQSLLGQGERWAAEEYLFEKRLAAFHWMKQQGIKILNEVEKETE